LDRSFEWLSVLNPSLGTGRPRFRLLTTVLAVECPHNLVRYLHLLGVFFGE